MKKVFVRSGIRYDYLLAGHNEDFLRELVEYHVSGQLKVAPEHCVAHVLDYMGKPHFDVFERFWGKYQRYNRKAGKELYLVPFLMSSHPGCTLQDAVALAEFLHSTGHQPQQVQDFYPTPGTLSTCMYYTGIDPRDMTPVYVATDPHEKALQRALLQWRKPEMRRLVVEALHRCGREDLIGYGPHCLIRPLHGGPARGKQAEEKQKGRGGRTASARKEAPGSGRGGKGGRTAKGAANGKGQGPGRTQKGKGPQSGAARSGKFSARTARPGKSARPAPKAPRSGKGTKPSAPKRRSR